MAAQQPYIPQGQVVVPQDTTQYLYPAQPYQQPGAYPPQVYAQQQPVVYPTQPGAQPQQQQQQPIIITQQVYVPKSTIYRTYRERTGKILGSLQIAGGILSIMFAAIQAGIIPDSDYWDARSRNSSRRLPQNWTPVVVAGVWSGVFVSTVIIVTNTSIYLLPAPVILHSS